MFYFLLENKIKIESISDRPSTSTNSGLIGSTLAAAGFTLSNPAMQMENLMSANPNQEVPRRSSTPTANAGGGFSSIFNLKSVISAATKGSAQQQQHQTTNSNFYVPPPITVPTAAEQSAAIIESHASASPKSIQGTKPTAI